MLSVTIPALGHLPDSSFKIGAAVDAVRVGKRSLALAGLAAFPMTDGCAIDIRKNLFVGNVAFPLFRPDHMAGCAGERCVRRPEEVLFIDPEFFADRRSGTVAGQALGVR